MMRILITSSRNWTNADMLVDLLEAYWQPGMVVVHGDAKTGGDRMAHEWAEQREGVTPEPHAAKWTVNGQLDITAGYKRNQFMVDLGAERCLAFIAPCVKMGCRTKEPHPSHGTVDCVERARRARIVTRCFVTEGLDPP